MRKNLFFIIAALCCATMVSAIDGTLPGKFTINNQGDQVQFAQGNLQYQPSTGKWRFAPNQYTALVEGNASITDAEYSGWMDLFAWGTGDNPMKLSSSSADYPFFTDWGINPIENGGNKPNAWRTLSEDEWSELFDWDKMAVGNVCGKDGYIYLPDDWELPEGLTFVSAGDDAREYSDNIYNPTQWAKMEAAGALFLPVCGYGSYYNGELGVAPLSFAYWTSSSAPASNPTGTDDERYRAYCMYQRGGDNRLLSYDWSRRSFFGVRLVCDVPRSDAIDNTSVETKSTKRIENGQLLIERGDKTYNALGAEVK